jgi:hypothetical protein
MRPSPGIACDNVVSLAPGDTVLSQASIRQSPLSGKLLRIKAWIIRLGRYRLESEVGYVLKLDLVHRLGPRSVKGVAREGSDAGVAIQEPTSFTTRTSKHQNC